MYIMSSHFSCVDMAPKMRTMAAPLVKLINILKVATKYAEDIRTVRDFSGLLF